MKAMEKLSYNWRIEKREAKRDGKQQKQKERYPWKNIKIKHFIFSKILGNTAIHFVSKSEMRK